MASERQRALFEEARLLPAADRAEFLRHLGDDDRAVVEQLLAELESAGTMLQEVGWRERRKTFQAGQVVAERFTIEKWLGAGGMGEVYAATDRILRTEVALKTIRHEYAEDPRFTTRLRREVQLARQVSHPNVCRIHEIGVHEGDDGADLMFCTMELLAGHTLSEELKRVGRVEVKRAEAIAEHLVAGLAALHERGILHRDFKSSNVMLVEGEGGQRAVITDFGLARQQEGVTTAVSAVGMVAGTPAYMSPEQMQGHALTYASDVYSLGVVLFEMVTGRLPFVAETPLALGLARLQQAAPSPREINTEVPERWEAAILACLEVEEEKRPRLEEILPLLKGEQRLPGRGRRWFVAAGGMAAALGGAGIWWAAGARQANPEVERRLKLGDEFAKRRTKEDLLHAIEEYSAVVQMEPRNARGWAGQADAYSALSNYGFMDPREALGKARAAATRALEVRGGSGRSHGVLGYIVSIHLEQWQQAEPHLRRAVALDGRDPMVRLWYGAFLGKSGRANEAVAQLRAGLETDPAHFLLNHQLGMELFCGRRFAEFFAHMQEVLRLHPFEAGSHLMMARALEWRGQYEAALRACEEGMKYRNSPSALCVRGSVEASRGNQKEARRIAEEVEAHWRGNPFESQLLVGLYARMGDKAKAIAVLEEGMRRFDNSLLRVPTSPYSDGLETEPGYGKFLKAIGWPPKGEKA